MTTLIIKILWLTVPVEESWELLDIWRSYETQWLTFLGVTVSPWVL